MADQRKLPEGTRVLVYYTGTTANEPHIGGIGSVELDGHNGLLRRLDGTECVVPVVTITSATRDRLTEREINVLESAAAGWTNHKIARNLGVSEDTVKTHMRSLCQKFGATNRVDVVVKAIVFGALHVANLPGARPPTLPALTHGEILLLPFIAAGLDSSETARRMGLSHHTVKAMERSIRQKWAVTRRADVVMIARREGLLRGGRG